MIANELYGNDFKTYLIQQNIILVYGPFYLRDNVGGRKILCIFFSVIEYYIANEQKIIISKTLENWHIWKC